MQTQKTNLWLPKGKRGGINYEFQISRYKLLYIKQINNKVLNYTSILKKRAMKREFSEKYKWLLII